MYEAFMILIADRNRNVREFLKRELAAEGYRVQSARDGREVMAIVKGDSPPDLLILDLEIPYTGGLDILEEIQRSRPPLPVVIHTFLPEYSNTVREACSSAIVEKSENTDILKAAVLEMLKKFYPHRFIGRHTQSQ